jgi:uncharacterized RDD family membrane protein YckC
MQSNPNETKGSAIEKPSQLTPEYKKLHARPWVRFFARYIDITIVSIVIGIILGIFNPSLISNSTIVFGMEVLFIWFLIEPIFLSTCGTTLGKWILNIKVRDINGEKPKFYNAFTRSFWVWVVGFGFGIPIVNLFTLISSYSQLNNTGTTSWDKNNFTVTHGEIGVIRIIITLIIIISAIFLSIYGAIQTQQQYTITTITNQIQSLNKDLPKQIDQETELTSVILKNMVVNYNYRLLNKNSSEVNADYINSSFKTNLINQVCNDNYMKGMLENAYRFSYNYKDKNGNDITNIQVNINDCNH